MNHEQCGGFLDLQGIFSSAEEAIAFCTDKDFEWAHIADGEKIVKTYATSFVDGRKFYFGEEGKLTQSWLDGDKEKTFLSWYELPEWQNGKVSGLEEIKKLYEDKL